MALQVTFIFICAGLTGIHSVSTVGHVAVKVGDTVHIPCKYENKYKNNVKYLCRGATWRSCTYEITTNQRNSAKYSISDDKNQRVVTFTIKNLQFADDDYYWCIIEKLGTDDGIQFQVSVTIKGESNLHVDSQRITYFGNQVVIYCNYRGSGPKQWCRVGGACVSTSGQIDGALVTTDTRVPGVFAVTMTGLFQRNIGWYWCSSGDLQMPVFVDVTVRPTTTTIATTTTATIATTTTTVTIATTTTTTTIATITTATTEPTPAISTNEPGGSVSGVIIAAVIALGLLILIAVVSVVVWFMLKRNIKNTEGSQSEKDQEVVYSDIIIRSQPSSNRKKSADDPVYSNVTKGSTLHQNPCADKEMEISYSSVRFINTQASKKVTAKEEDVVYSTLATQ